MVMNTMSRGCQAQGFEWILAQDVVTLLQHCWLVIVDLFASSLSFVLCVVFGNTCHFAAMRWSPGVYISIVYIDLSGLV